MKMMFYFLVLSLLIEIPALAQDEGFLYGKVYTDDLVYEGPIRWGKEEVYWCDMFNAAKERNENIDHLSNEDREALEEKQNRDWFGWHDNISNWFHWRSSETRVANRFVHQFSCQFGEIKTIQPTGSQAVRIEMKNGIKFDLDGEGYNDVGLDIKVMDRELGEIEVYWNRINKVEFMNTPGKLATTFGEPLVGTVEAYGEKFRGFIQWDHDERLSTDKLDADGDDGSVSIEFGKIRSIERKGSRSLVILKSGRELLLSGSNDVASGHRGVIVMNSKLPGVDIPWSEFNKIVFEEKSNEAITRYEDFNDQQQLHGMVTKEDGKSLSGRIVYDLDEEHGFELLQGKAGEFEYSIPFRKVKRIIANGSQCSIELSDDTKIALDEGQDVNERNQGVLVFASGDKDPSYIPWDDVKEINFK